MSALALRALYDRRRNASSSAWTTELATSSAPRSNAALDIASSGSTRTGCDPNPDIDAEVRATPVTLPSATMEVVPPRPIPIATSPSGTKRRDPISRSPPDTVDLSTAWSSMEPSASAGSDQRNDTCPAASTRTVVSPPSRGSPHRRLSDGGSSTTAASSAMKGLAPAATASVPTLRSDETRRSGSSRSCRMDRVSAFSGTTCNSSQAADVLLVP